MITASLFPPSTTNLSVCLYPDPCLFTVTFVIWPSPLAMISTVAPYPGLPVTSPRTPVRVTAPTKVLGVSADPIAKFLFRYQVLALPDMICVPGVTPSPDNV